MTNRFENTISGNLDNKRTFRIKGVRDDGIQSKVAKKFIITTNSKNTLSPEPDLLKRNFKTTKANEAWVSDTTFIRTRQGWLYLAIMLDLYSRKVIGWAMSERNDTKLVSDAFMMAVWRQGKVTDVIVHSDQGSSMPRMNTVDYSKSKACGVV